MIRRRRFHQVVFTLAGIYNLAWGAYTILDPQWLFRFAGMPPINYPDIFACLGMVVGVYGFLYWQVARDPEHGLPIALVGFLGKVLGPIGLVRLLVTGVWPLRSAILCVTNDLIWWIPFALYVMDALAAGREVRREGGRRGDASSASSTARTSPAARA